MGNTAGRGSDQFVLRLPDGMRDRIKATADANNRSMNAEILSVLWERFPEPDSPPPPLYEELMAIPEARAEIEAFFERLAQKVSQDDIADGLIPGLGLRKGD